MKDYLKQIEKKIFSNLEVEKIKIYDNSNKHKTHKFFNKDKYHLLIEIESQYLKSLDRLSAQRTVMTILKDDFKDKIHALEIKIK
tara:strand:- start:493 stop:747 length:255 start_codon:yes stop_codon:yes gene_type:complete